MDSLALYPVIVPTSILTLDCLPSVSTGHRYHSTWMSHHYLKLIHPLFLTVPPILSYLAVLTSHLGDWHRHPELIFLIFYTQTPRNSCLLNNILFLISLVSWFLLMLLPYPWDSHHYLPLIWWYRTLKNSLVWRQSEFHKTLSWSWLHFTKHFHAYWPASLLLESSPILAMSFKVLNDDPWRPHHDHHLLFLFSNFTTCNDTE